MRSAKPGPGASAVDDSHAAWPAGRTGAADESAVADAGPAGDPLAADPLATDRRTGAPAAGPASVAAPGAEGTKAAMEPLVRVAPASATAYDGSGPPARVAAMRAADCAFGPGSPGCAPTAIVDEDHPDEDRTADDRVARRTVPRSMPRPRRASSAQPGRWLAR
jgi:hypothetical protein